VISRVSPGLARSLSLCTYTVSGLVIIGIVFDIQLLSEKSKLPDHGLTHQENWKKLRLNVLNFVAKFMYRVD